FYTFIVISLVSLLIIGWVINNFYSSSNLEKPVTLVFASGTHFSEMVDKLAENNVIKYPFIFKSIMWLNGKSSRVKAGEYLFSANISPKEVSILLASGKTVIRQITIPEGLTSHEIIEIIKNNEYFSGEITLDIKEGELLPETYNFARGDKRNDIINRMRLAMNKVFEEAWVGRDNNLPFSDKNSALTLASIVEKETSLPSERSRVAAVYINRLKKGMLLQADPTTIYAVTLGKYKLNHPLNHADLALKSPYNTYQTLGLPPTPIANPGKASIIAALHPISSDELYFVANGSGGHNFASTIGEHSENVRKYRALQK
ncbi:MAG: endolytic transglycosylase MltG, partial [Pseudomonadota bacterium]